MFGAAFRIAGSATEGQPFPVWGFVVRRFESGMEHLGNQPFSTKEETEGCVVVQNPDSFGLGWSQKQCCFVRVVSDGKLAF